MTDSRLASLDVFRGLTMAFLTLQVLKLPLGAQRFPESEFWQFVATQTSHAPWLGMTAWDLIQPAFIFMVGAALPWSIASRQQQQSVTSMWAHAVWRALALVALGIGLRSLEVAQTNFVFTDVLAQIGLGYLVAFALCLQSQRVQVVSALLLLVGYALAFMLWPAVESWLRTDNPAHAFDVWFLNLFPREEIFVQDPGGYATLNFIPSIGTMLMGLWAGHALRYDAARALHRLVLGGVGCVLAGWLLDATGMVPSIKRLWTPAWVLLSGGIVTLLLALLHWVVDRLHTERWWQLFRIVGLNSLALYVVLHIWDAFLVEFFAVHLGWNVLGLFGQEYVVYGARIMAVLAMLGFCVWLHSKRLYLRL